MSPTFAKLRHAAVTAITVASMAVMPALVSAQEPPAQAGGEGVKVHGRWIIDVRNADGTLFSKHQLASPIVVTPNQVIDVRVIFSFS